MIESYIFVSTIKADNRQYRKILKKVYRFLIKLNNEYPGFDQWYWRSVIPDLDAANKEIIVAELENKIIGVAIIKKDRREKKICTLRVSEMFQHRGIGRQLMQLAFAELDTDRPFISVSSRKLGQFSNIFAYYGFRLEEENVNYYKNGCNEYCFNGFLPGHIYEPEFNSVGTEILSFAI